MMKKLWGWNLTIGLVFVFNLGWTCPAPDLSGDCAVGIDDLILFAEQWLDPVGCAGHPDDCADFVGDDGVTLTDFASMAAQWGFYEANPVVINEIHYHPDNNTEQVEFVELYNAGSQPVDLNGWYFEGAIGYTFQSVPVMNPGDYVLVSQNPTAFASKFGVSALGPFEGKFSNDGENLILRDSNGDKVDEVDYGSEFPWPIPANGEGASLELINPSLDNNLAGSWRSSGYNTNTRPELSFGAPTPGAINSVYSVNVPPQIRQVKHEPQQPLSTDPIRITAKVTDPNGVKQVYLKYQIVSPGNYVPAYLPIAISSLINNPFQEQPLNPDFENAANWVSVKMRDDGGLFPGSVDEVAGDGIFTYQLPAQANRFLIRYRIEATDNPGNVVRVPYFDDSSLNFACFVYNGVPSYVVDGDTSVNPDAQAGSDYTYAPNILTTIPVYTLITRSADLYQCNGYNSADRIEQSVTNLNYQYAGRVYNWEGAFVYDGKVYDHIGYRLRGGNGRYNNGAAGKRSMKFRFNRGNYFQARDIYGDKFPSQWQHLNTGKMFGNQVVWSGYRRYPYGVNEVMDMKLFGIADVPAAHTWWMHFRVIDGVDEAPMTLNGQYNGDFWGLYVAFENYDGAFLDRQGLPKGNLYKLSDKIYGGLDQLRYQGEYAVDNASDYENIRWNLTHEASAAFIRNYLDCDEWYRYHTVTEAIRHYDIFSGDSCVHCMKNTAWYFYPDYTANSYGKLQWLPFDIDDTWGPYFNQGCDHAKASIYDQRYLGGLEQFAVDPEKAPLKQEYRNYIREFRDLLWQPEVIDPMIAELASVIADIVPADRDRWRLDPTTGGPLDFGTLDDDLALMYQFAWTPGTYNGGFYWIGTSNNLDNLANADSDSSNIPNTPTISYIGTAGYPENDLQFQTSAFSDPQGAGTFAAIKWRIAEVEPSAGPSGGETITLLNQEAVWKYFEATMEPPSNWNQNGFNDGNWSTGQASIGFADGDDNTVIDMTGETSLYLRNTFTVADTSQISLLTLHVYVDDGCIIYINGTEVARLHCSAGNKYYNSTTETSDHEAPYATGIYEEVILNTPYNYLVNGTNVIAVHALQATTTSSDFSIDVSLTTETAESETPVPILSKKKYELQAVWESNDLAAFADTIRIPADGVKAGHIYRVRCKMKDNTGRWSHWSDPIEFVAGAALGSNLRNYLRVTEVMYNNDDADFIELKNLSSTATLNLSDVSLTAGVTFSFAGSNVTSLASGAFVLVVKDLTAFRAQYGTGLNSKIAGEFAAGSLSNSGETIKLEDTWDATIVEFEYNDGRGWPLAADGAGHSLVPLAAAIDPSQPRQVLNYGGNWRQSAYIGGSPGADDPDVAAGVMINEFMAHTDYSNPLHPEYDSNDWIELYNAGTSSVTLDGNWYLSDDIDNLKKWALPTSVLAAGGRISFDEVTGFHSPITSGFGLDKAGEQIFLSYLPGTSADRVVDCIQFKGQENSISLSRYPDGGPYWFSASPGTQNAANNNLVSHVVLSEIMYHPTEGTTYDEYIELYNPTNSGVDLWTVTGPWALDGGIDYEFPAGTTLSNGDRILVVDFDPAVETARLDAFEAAYGTGELTAGVNIFGPWSGDLSNSGERITLEKPQDSDDPLDPTAISWIIVDECIYNDYWPWPTEPDGTGLALRRLSSGAAASGNDAENWTAQTPTPGL